MIPFPYTMAGLGGSSFDPVTLFAGGEKGVLYDFTATANLYQDSARTTPVTARRRRQPRSRRIAAMPISTASTTSFPPPRST
jgi:hypothetical protein